MEYLFSGIDQLQDLISGNIKEKHCLEGYRVIYSVVRVDPGYRWQFERESRTYKRQTKYAFIPLQSLENGKVIVDANEKTFEIEGLIKWAKGDYGEPRIIFAVNGWNNVDLSTALLPENSILNPKLAKTFHERPHTSQTFFLTYRKIGENLPLNEIHYFFLKHDKVSIFEKKKNLMIDDEVCKSVQNFIDFYDDPDCDYKELFNHLENLNKIYLSPKEFQFPMHLLGLKHFDIQKTIYTFEKAFKKLCWYDFYMPFECLAFWHLINSSEDYYVERIFLRERFSSKIPSYIAKNMHKYILKMIQKRLNPRQRCIKSPLGLFHFIEERLKATQ